jgi:hypothetical protein
MGERRTKNDPTLLYFALFFFVLKFSFWPLDLERGVLQRGFNLLCTKIYDLL